MKKTKAQKGITLIALIITIIVLLILAVVSIRAIQGDGIIAKARKAAADYNQAQINEIDKMLEFEALISEKTGTSAVEISEAGIVLSETETTSVKDANGNIIKVPAGFKIVNTEDTVDKGIIIEDVSAGNVGSQFVWVPVGKVYTDVARTEANSKAIELNRYTFNESNGTPTPQGEALIDTCYQESKTTSDSDRMVAKNLQGFIESANNNGGYYIGRYEASIQSGGKIACKANEPVVDYIAQYDAATKSGNMYNSGTFTSDLTNSYAWDTAIVFIQKCSTKTDASIYSIANNSSGFRTTGNSLNEDEYCNINDMSGNAMEWTTETSSNSGKPCVNRGGAYVGALGDTVCYTSSRFESDAGGNHESVSFRPILYL